MRKQIVGRLKTGQCLLTDVSGIQLSKIFTIRETFISYIAAGFLSAQYKSIGRRKRRSTTIRRADGRQRENARGHSTFVTLSSMIYNYTVITLATVTVVQLMCQLLSHA